MFNIATHALGFLGDRRWAFDCDYYGDRTDDADSQEINLVNGLGNGFVVTCTFHHYIQRIASSFDNGGGPF